MNYQMDGGRKGKTMKKRIGWVVVVMVASFFSIGILFSSNSTLYATEKSPDLSGQAQKIDIKQLPETRKLNKKSPNRTQELDLRCEIKAFYDQARTKPLSGGQYDWGLKIYPSYIYYDITVENTGDPAPNQASPKARAALVARVVDVIITFRTILRSSTIGNDVQVKNFTQAVTNLGPGESHVFSFYGPAPSYGPTHYVFKEVRANVDPGNKVHEASRNNNTCSYSVNPK